MCALTRAQLILKGTLIRVRSCAVYDSDNDVLRQITFLDGAVRQASANDSSTKVGLYFHLATMDDKC